MIIKMQWPITSTEEVPQILIYNKNRSFFTTWPAEKHLKKLFKNRLKVYVYAEFKKGELIIKKETRIQDFNW